MSPPSTSRATTDLTWKKRRPLARAGTGDYPANFTQIKELLIKMGDLKVIQSDPIGASQLGRMHLAEPGKGADSATCLNSRTRRASRCNRCCWAKSTPTNPTGLRRCLMATRKCRRPLCHAGSDPNDSIDHFRPLNTSIPNPPTGWTRIFSKSRKPKSISFRLHQRRQFLET
jgi:hypothetical protein